MTEPTIYSYIKSEEALFETEEIQVGQNWTWNFRTHVQLIFHLINGVFFQGTNGDWSRAFKNVMRPLLHLSFWAEDIELKDVVFFIENHMGRALSFLVKKYHDEVYVRENDLDTFFDEITESDLTYGGVLVQKTDTKRPEVLPLTTIAFADQTDLVGGPLAFKHHFSPDKLRSMSKLGWGEKSNGATISIEELITLATAEKAPSGLNDARKNRTTGKVIEVYIVRGNLPKAYLYDDDDFEDHCNQIHIVAFYTNKENKKEGVTLYRKKEAEGNMKFFTSSKVPGRALGMGDGESFLHPQVWTNFLTTHKQRLLEAAAKVPLFTDDSAYATRNKIQDMENLEITVVDQNSKFGIQQVPTAAPANIRLYAEGINEWFEHAQLEGSAYDPILGKESPSGTTFRGQERTVAQGRGFHDRRRGQRAKFIEEIYRDWIIPDMVKEIVKGKEFLATLTTEELLWVSEQLAENYAHRKQTEEVLNGELVSDKEELKQEFKQSFSKRGNKHLLQILEDEFRGIEIKMGVNVAAKQKDLVNLSDKLLSIFQFVFANPAGFQQAMQIPALAKSFNDLLEFAGLNQVDFASLLAAPPQQMMQPQETAQPQPQAQMMLAKPAQ